MSVDSMQALVDQYVAAFNKNDTALVASFYRDAARVLPPGQDVIQSKAAIASFIAGLFDMGVKALEIEPQTREQRADLGVEVGLFTMRPTPGGPPIDAGKYVSVRHQQADGTWLIDVDIFNSSQPPPGNP